MQHRHREVLVNILKMYGGTTPRTISPHPSAPTPQDHILQQMLYQQQQQRIPSPMNNGKLSIVYLNRICSKRVYVDYFYTFFTLDRIHLFISFQTKMFFKSTFFYNYF